MVSVFSLFSAGLIGHLRTALAPMFHLYMAIKEQSSDEIMADNIAVTSGRKILHPEALSEFLQKLESSSMTIQKAFKKQVKAAIVSHVFFELLMKLMFQRVLGIRTTSRNCLQSGSSQWINRFIQLKNLNFKSCSCICITYHPQ